MDAYFLYMTSRLEELRRGEKTAEGWLPELTSWPFWRDVIAEFLATLLFVFIGTMSTLGTEGSDAKFIKVGLTFGLMVAVCIQMIGHVSGGHINPAVSIAMMVAREINPTRAVLYVIAQCGGGVAGSFLLKALSPSYFHDNLGVTTVNSDLDEWQGFVCEMVFTFILLMSIFGCTDPNRALFGSPALGIGITVGVLHFAGIPFTGASMNPARSLASAVASNKYDAHWVYWAGPIAGGCVAAVVYKYFLSPYKQTKSVTEAQNELSYLKDMMVIPRALLSSENSNGLQTMETAEGIDCKF